MKHLHRLFIRLCNSAGADKFLRDPLRDVTNISDPQSSNMRHMVNDVSAPSGVSSNDLMVILDIVFYFESPYINLS